MYDLMKPLLLDEPSELKAFRNYSGDDPFRILGVTRDMSHSEIDRAYRRLVKYYHPDVNKSDEACSKFKRINDAYLFIKNNPELSKLVFRCEIAGYKKEHSDFLFSIRRLKVLTGIDQEFTKGKLLGTEVDKRAEKLFIAFVTKCPNCRWKIECDRVTGFSEVENLHNELVEKAMSSLGLIRRIIVKITSF